MNVEVGTEAAQFPEKDYINGIFVAVYSIENKWSKDDRGKPWLIVNAITGRGDLMTLVTVTS